jgi:hypothetical protein
VGRPLWREDGSAICSVITQWSETRRTRNQTSLSHLRLPKPRGEVRLLYDWRSVSQSVSMSWYRAPLCDLRPDITSCLKFAVLYLWGSLSDERTALSKSKLLYDWRSVSQSVSQNVLVSSSLVALATRYYFLSEIYGLVSVGRPLWREDESVEVKITSRLTVSQSVCLGIEHPSGTCDQILLPVGDLQSCIYWAPSLTKGRVCNSQCNHSMVRVSSETPPTWRARFPYLHPPGRGWPRYTPEHCYSLSFDTVFIRADKFVVKMRLGKYIPDLLMLNHVACTSGILSQAWNQGLMRFASSGLAFHVLGTLVCLLEVTDLLKKGSLTAQELDGP